MLKHKYISILIVTVLVSLFVLGFYFEVRPWIFVAVLFTWLVFTTWGSFDIRINYFVRAYSGNPREKERKIAITFDDGPHEMTPQVLDLLQRFNVKATFFCIGSRIEQHPEIFRRILAEGHVAGNHTYSHSKSFGFFSAEKITQEINQTNALAENLSGKKNLLFRPPFGVTTPNLRKAIRQTKQSVIGWNIRSLDTVTEDENQVFERIRKRIVPGGIILLHDTSLKTVHVLERLLLHLKSENYEVVPVTELLNIPAYED